MAEGRLKVGSNYLKIGALYLRIGAAPTLTQEGSCWTWTTGSKKWATIALELDYNGTSFASIFNTSGSDNAGPASSLVVPAGGNSYSLFSLVTYASGSVPNLPTATETVGGLPVPLIESVLFDSDTRRLSLFALNIGNDIDSASVTFDWDGQSQAKLTWSHDVPMLTDALVASPVVQSASATGEDTGATMNISNLTDAVNNLIYNVISVAGIDRNADIAGAIPCATLTQLNEYGGFPPASTTHVASSYRIGA